ncbi:hypothetical protein GCK32_012975 [Trichostrongylus colubriformis]|uniref:Uncharacterized protein n=1 Tax=Trichostrongylus colubriformis TaxID=6319 RepID=A0AAN8IUI4_TRICO
MSCLNLTTAKQRITRLLNDLSHIISECSQYSEGWEFPKNPKELYIFIRTQRNIVNSTVEKLEMKLEKVTAIYGETMTRISEVTTDSDELAKNLQAYWEERNGESILEEARAMIQDLEMRVTELATQDMHIAYADEFDAHLRQRDMPQSDSDPVVARAEVVVGTEPAKRRKNRMGQPTLYEKEEEAPTNCRKIVRNRKTVPLLQSLVLGLTGIRQGRRHHRMQGSGSHQRLNVLQHLWLEVRCASQLTWWLILFLQLKYQTLRRIRKR